MFVMSIEKNLVIFYEKYTQQHTLRTEYSSEDYRDKYGELYLIFGSTHFVLITKQIFET